MGDPPSGDANIFDQAGRREDWERNLDPTRSFAEFDSRPSSQGSLGLSQNVSNHNDPSTANLTSSALGFLPYFSNEHGLQLGAQPLIPFNAHQAHVDQSHLAGIHYSAPTSRISSAVPLNPSYSPSPLGSALPWSIDTNGGLAGLHQSQQHNNYHSLHRPYSQTYVQNQRNIWPDAGIPLPSSSALPIADERQSASHLGFALYPNALSSSTGHQGFPNSNPTATSFLRTSTAPSTTSNLPSQPSNLGAYNPEPTYLPANDHERFLEQVNAHLSQVQSQDSPNSASSPRTFEAQLAQHLLQQHSNYGSPSSPSTSTMSPMTQGSPYSSTSTANMPIYHGEDPTQLQRLALDNLASVEHARRASYPSLPNGLAKGFSSLPASPGSVGYAPSPEFAQAVNNRLVPSGLSTGFSITKSPPTAAATTLPAVSRIKKPPKSKVKGARSRQASAPQTASASLRTSPATNTRPLPSDLNESPQLPSPPRDLPSSPNTPALESFYDPNHPTVVIAKTNRALVGATPSATPSPSSTPAGTPVATKAKDLPMIKSGKVLLESDVSCGSCRRPLATLIYRGKENEFRAPYHPRFTCFACQPPRDEYGNIVIPGPNPEDLDEITYENSVSAVLDQLSGLDIRPTEAKLPQGRGKIAFAGSKKRRADEEPLTCDVCQRDLALGGVFKDHDQKPVDFMIEIVCVSCASKYQRCSDCGGGGGGRCGIGKWRCKELFQIGRRNCTLSHVRQGPQDAQSYEIFSADEVPPEELDELIAKMREVVINAIMSMGAIPDILESPTPLARTFDELQRYAVDTWSVFEPLARTNEEKSRNIRRYFALRWTTPHKRKKKIKTEPPSSASPPNMTATTMARDEGSDDSQSATSPTSGNANVDIDGRVVKRKNKILASFVFGELDLSLGSAFPMLVMPKGIGDAYDQNTILMQKMLRRMEEDIAEINARRIPAGLSPWPKLDEVWTMAVYKKESSFLNRTGARRGFVSLADYLAMRPDREHHFPPHRPCYLPPELTKGWVITARTWDETSDLLVPSGRNRRKGESSVLVKGRDLPGMVSNSPRSTGLLPLPSC